MKTEDLYERRQTLDRMESTMVIASVVGALTAIFVMLNNGWVAGVAMFLLSLVAFALSRGFVFLSAVLGDLDRIERNTEAKPLKKDPLAN